jgi:peptidoglycan/LPS O-acetylase OafA/YrhL
LLIAVILWACVCHHRSLAFRWLSFRPLAYIGLLSYSIYLWQNPFFNAHGDTWWTRWPANAVLVTAFAFLSYYLVERPFLVLKGRLGR